MRTRITANQLCARPCRRRGQEWGGRPGEAGVATPAHLHNGTHSAAIALPHAAEAGLSPDVPELGEKRVQWSQRQAGRQPNPPASQAPHPLTGAPPLPGPPPSAPTLMVTFPLVILRMLNPTVGIMSSLNCPDWREKSGLDTGQKWTGPACTSHRQRPGQSSSAVPLLVMRVMGTSSGASPGVHPTPGGLLRMRRPTGLST